MEFRIPEPALKPLGDFINLSDEEVSRLVKAISEAEPTLGAERLAPGVVAKSRLDSTKTEEILSMFGGLHVAMTRAERPLDEFISDITLALRQRHDKHLTPRDWKTFEANLRAVLGKEGPLGISAKALDLFLDNEKGFHSARILTDVRHIFTTDPSTRPSACVVVHRLNIVYHKTGGMREIYVTLDGEDLENLKLAIERAEVKEQNLKNMLKEDGIKCVSASYDN